MSAAGGGNVVLEDKTYYLTQSIIPKSNVNLIGQGPDTVITWDPLVADTINQPMITDDGSTALLNIGFSDFRMVGTVDTSDLNDRDRGDHMAIFFNGPGDPAIAGSLRHHGIMIANLEVSQFGGIGIHIKGSNNLTTLDLDMYDNGWYPEDLLHNFYLLRVRNVSMYQTDSDGGFRDSPSGHGLRMASLENVYLEGLIVEGNADHGIHMNDVANMVGYDITSSDNCQDLMGACSNVRCYGDECDYDFNADQTQDPYYFAEVQAPFLAHQAPGVIEAEAFDVGGNNLAYHDTGSGNSFSDGDGYRNTDVDLVELNAGNYKVGYIEEGEWLEYTIDLEAGAYRVDFLASSNRAAGGEVELVIDGISYGTTLIPSTGNWNTFRTFSLYDVAITDDSTSVIRLNMGGEGFDLDNYAFVKTLPGDFDQNGIVDESDYAVWASTYGTDVAAGTGADGNFDGTVDTADYTIWRDQLGAASATATAVPEPAGWSLLLAALTATKGYRWRKRVA